MSVGDITREAVLAAMDEFDAIGLDGFRNRYRFGAPRDYWVLRPGTGQRYPAKAIVGVAHGHMPGGVSLRSDQFYGGQGEQAANSILTKLDFEIVTGPADLNSASGPSDRVRSFVITNYIEPARRKGDALVELVSGDIHREMRLENHMPTVCQVLDGRKFSEQAGVTLVNREGPERSSTVRYRFEISGAAVKDNWAEAELSRRYGKPFLDNAKMLAWSLPDGRQIAMEKLARVQLWLEGDQSSGAGLQSEIYDPARTRHSNLPERLKMPHVASKIVVSDVTALRALLDQYDGGRESFDQSNLDRLKARFLAQFPDFERNGGFSTDEWREKDDPHRVHTMKEITALKQRGVSTSDLGTQVLDLLGDKRNIHLQHFARQRILETIRTAHPGVLEEAMGKLVAGDGYPSQLAGQFLDAIWPLLQEAATGSNPFAESRIFASLPLALARPDEAISINYQRFQTFARALCHKALFANAPLREEEYAEANSLARKTLDIMRDEWGWRPRDLWDVQSFIWSTCGSALEDTAGELDPTPIWIVTARYGDEDGLPRFIERGEFSLLDDTGSSSNKRMAEMRAGDHIFLRDYFHQTHDLPFDANGGRVSAIRIRAKGRIIRESEDRLSVGVEWDELAEPRVWYFYTFTDPVWGLKPLNERQSADLLRRFLLLGEPQDYDWFLNDPYWRDRLFGKPKEKLSVAKPTNLILYGPPGTGKTYRTAQEAVRLCDGDADYGEDDEGRAALMQRYGDLVKEKRIEFVTFHQNFGYEDFVEGLRPTTGPSDGQTAGGFELKPEAGIFRRIADRAAAPVMKTDDAFSLDDRSVFKLSLGEAGKAEWEWVFEDKRLGQPNALTVRLPYSKREFGVPSNLHVIGTMNTADRSIALLDTALRRRFRFEEIAPEPWRLGTVGDIPLAKVLTVINERIEYLIDRDHRIGHAFFMGDGGKDRRAIDATMRDKVIPLLQEYFFEDWSRITSVVGDGFLEKTVLKAPPGIQGEARDSWAVRSEFLPDAYDRLLKGSLPDEGEGAPTHDDGDE